MPKRIIRTRFFLAVEGESEQAFVTWLQRLSEAKLHIHLDTFPLGGGGYKTMLENAIREHERRRKISGSFKSRILIVDSDRASQGDWPIEKLRQEAARAGFLLCVQRPNHEGLLLRMIPGMERENADAGSAETKLKKRWAAYQKPANANALNRQFSLDDLFRAATVDTDLQILLDTLGLIRNSR